MNNILNVDGTGVLSLFLTKMFVTTTPRSWQQTENYITWKFFEYVAIKVLLHSYFSGFLCKISFCYEIVG